MIAGAIFLAAALGVLYPLAIYPAAVVLLAALRPRPWSGGRVEGGVAHIVTVYNEASRIRAKLENALAVAPRDRPYEILVASDGSTDATETIVAEFADRGVRWLPFARRGKEHAQRDAIAATDAPWIVFSDASTRLRSEAVERILRPFADPAVGAVSGTDRLDEIGERTGEGLYTRYEMALRRAEARVWTLAGLSGSFFAARREVASRILEDVPSDMGAAWIAVASGLRAVAADDAIVTYSATTRAGREFRRKRRTALRGIRGVFRYRSALSWRRPLATWQLVSHKAIRFLSPFFSTAALVALAFAWFDGQAWARWTAPAAAAGLALGGLALVFPAGMGRLKPLRAAAFFLIVNAALLAAWWSWARGGRDVTWTPTARA